MHTTLNNSINQRNLLIFGNGASCFSFLLFICTLSPFKPSFSTFPLPCSPSPWNSDKLTNDLHFQNFNTNNIHQLKLLGNAAISQDHGFIQIPDPSSAGDQTYQAGRAIYSSPIRLFDPITETPASFHTTFSFQFTTANNSNPGINLKGGNGLAFVIVPDEFTIGRPGPWLGILNDACDHYKAFAVEFDSSHDPNFGDPNDDHVGVNLGSVVSFKTANSSETNASLHDNSIHRAWITYDGHRKWIDIYLGVDGNIHYSHFFKIIHTRFSIFLPITSSTASSKILLSFSFFCLLQQLCSLSATAHERGLLHNIERIIKY